jgi:hypothetical protein
VTVSIRDRLQASLSVARKARDAVSTSVLRTTLSAIANAEAVEVAPGTAASEVPRKHLTENDIRAVVEAELRDLHSSAVELRQLGRDADADLLDAKACVLSDHLAT